MLALEVIGPHGNRDLHGSGTGVTLVAIGTIGEGQFGGPVPHTVVPRKNFEAHCGRALEEYMTFQNTREVKVYSASY